MARITGAPTLYAGRLYVPVSSTEERAAGFSAPIRAAHFAAAWWRWTPIPGGRSGRRTSFRRRPSPRAKLPKACSCLGRRAARCGIRRRSIRGTTCFTSERVTPTTSRGQEHRCSGGAGHEHGQDTLGRAGYRERRVAGGLRPQGTSENCPQGYRSGLRFRFFAHFAHAAGGKRILVAGQKSGVVWGHDPDKQGAVVWKAQLVDKLAIGMITFGGAADGERLFWIAPAASPPCELRPATEEMVHADNSRLRGRAGEKRRRSGRFPA